MGSVDFRLLQNSVPFLVIVRLSLLGLLLLLAAMLTHPCLLPVPLPAGKFFRDGAVCVVVRWEGAVRKGQCWVQGMRDTKTAAEASVGNLP